MDANIINILNSFNSSFGMAMLAVLVLIPFVIYLYFAYALMTLAHKTNARPAWLAWIPIADAFLTIRISGKPDWWFVFYLFPPAFIVVYIMAWMQIAAGRNRPSWFGVLMVLPVINLVIIYLLAFTGEGGAVGSRNGDAHRADSTDAPSKFFTEYYVVAFLFLMAAFVGTALFVHRPLITEIKRLNADTQSRLLEAENERTYLKSVEGSVAAAQSIPSGVLQSVDQALPTDQNIPSLLLQLGAAALRNNVQIDSVSFGEKTQATAAAGLPTGMIAPMDITLSVRASSYFEMKRFLVSIEKSLRIMDVLTLMSSGDSDGQLTYSIQLRTYSYIPPASRVAQP